MTPVLLVGSALAAIAWTSVGFQTGQGDLASVERRSIRTSLVERGTLDRSVSSPGALVPERIRWITAATAARVERLEVEPGEPVDADTAIIRLRNPDLELAALEARSQLAAARAELTNLAASLETERLAQQAAVTSVRTDQSEATRVAAANETLARVDSVSRAELERAKERAEELTSRLAIEKRRLGVLSRARGAQVEAHRARVEQLEAVVSFRERQLEELDVKAGEVGVLQERAVEVGQWVQPGTLLAKVARPDRLKARLRVPEIRAKDVRVGQDARIDTHNGVVKGEVSRVDPAVTDGVVEVDVRLQGALPDGARPDLSIDGVVRLERLEDVVWLRRPAHAEPGSMSTLFVVEEDGTATRTRVRFGRGSADAIEILEGLAVGDEVIVSDTTTWADEERIRIE